MIDSPLPTFWPNKTFDLVLDYFGWRGLCINQWKFGGHGGDKLVIVDFFFEPSFFGIALQPGKSGFFRRINVAQATGVWGLNGVRHALAAVANIELRLNKPGIFVAEAAQTLAKMIAPSPLPLQTDTDCEKGNQMTDKQWTGGNLVTFPRETILATLDNTVHEEVFLHLSNFHQVFSSGSRVPYFNDHARRKVIRLLLVDFEVKSDVYLEKLIRKPRKNGLSVASTRIAKELISLAPFKPMRKWSEKMKANPNKVAKREKDAMTKWMKPKTEKSATGSKVEQTVDAVFKFFKKSKKPCASKDFRKAVLKAGKILAKKGLSQAYDSLKKQTEVIAKKAMKRQIQIAKKSVKGRVKRMLMKKLGIPKIPKRFPSKKALIKKGLKKSFRSLVKKFS